MLPNYVSRSVDGDADAAVETRIRIGWNKFRQLVPLLTNKDISLTVRGRLYSSCVRSSMLRGSDSVAKCGMKSLVKLLLLLMLDIDDVISVLQQNRLRWYGHVLRKRDNDWVKN